MVKVIMGLKGAGKTKKLIDLVNKAADEEHGDVVCIEKGAGLTYDISIKSVLFSLCSTASPITIFLRVL